MRYGVGTQASIEHVHWPAIAFYYAIGLIAVIVTVAFSIELSGINRRKL